VVIVLWQRAAEMAAGGLSSPRWHSHSLMAVRTSACCQPLFETVSDAAVWPLGAQGGCCGAGHCSSPSRSV
jgi:hypothetical protein